MRSPGLTLTRYLVLAAGGAFLPLTLLGRAVDRGPSDETAVVFDGQTDTIDGSVTCTTQPDGELVILATDGVQKSVRVLLSREHQLVVRKVGVRLGGVRAYAEDPGNMWATKVDDAYSINGRMPPNAGEAMWHDFKIDVRCHFERAPEPGDRGP